MASSRKPIPRPKPTVGLAQSTRARRLSAIRQLFRFAHDEGWRADNPAIRIKGPGAVQRLPKALSQEEVTRLMEAARAFGRSGADRRLGAGRCIPQAAQITPDHNTSTLGRKT